MIAHHIADSIATITLDAPATRNALTLAGWHALAHTVATIADAAPRAVIVHANCSGSDIREIATLADDAARRAPFRQAMRAGRRCACRPRAPVRRRRRSNRHRSRR